MKKRLINLKSNKGFTMQDVAAAIVILILFAGVIGGSYISVYKVQSETKITAKANIYAIQIMENINKISYDEVAPGMEGRYRDQFNIPSEMNLDIEVKQHDSENQLKDIKVTISYTFADKTETLVLQGLKVKEL